MSDSMARVIRADWGDRKSRFSARMFAVADVFDALTSDRVYKKAISVGDAVKILRDSCGSHLTPLRSRPVFGAG